MTKCNHTKCIQYCVITSKRNCKCMIKFISNKNVKCRSIRTLHNIFRSKIIRFIEPVIYDRNIRLDFLQINIIAASNNCFFYTKCHISKSIQYICQIFKIIWVIKVNICHNFALVLVPGRSGPGAEAGRGSDNAVGVQLVQSLR